MFCHVRPLSLHRLTFILSRIMNELTIKVLKAAVCAAASYLAGKAVDAAVKNYPKNV